MARSFSVPFHFAVEFLVLVVSIGAVVEAVRAWRRGAGGWAIGQALGFFSLAVAQGLHGSLLAPADGDGVVLVSRVVGFSILALAARPGVAVAPAPAIGAPVAVPALFVPGASASWAFVPGIAAMVVAVRGVAAHRRDQDPATFAFAAAFVSFAAAEAATALAPAEGGAALGFAHGARAAAALFLARWLWTSIVGSLRLRVVSTFVVLLTLAVLVVSGALNAVITGTLEREDLKRLAEAGQARVTRFRDLGEAGVVTAATFSRAAGVQTVLDDRNGAWDGASGEAERRRQADVLSASVLRLAPSSTDLVLLVDRRNRVLGSASIGEEGRVAPLARLEALLLGGSDVVEEALTRGPATSATTTEALGAGADVQERLLVLSAAPAREGSRLLGAVVTGSRIDDRFLRDVAEDVGAEATLVVGDSVAATTVADPIDVAAAVASIEERISTFSRGTIVHTFRLGGETYPTVFVPARSADRQLLGFLALSQRGDAVTTAERDMTQTLFLIALLAAVIAALLAWVSGGRVTRPIRSLTEAARDLREGHLEVRTRVASRDEVGTLGAAFNDMADELQRKTGDLEYAAAEEASLRARMESIVQSMGDGLIATDAEGTIVTFNRAAEQLLKVRADRVIGSPIGDVVVGTTGSGRRLAEAALTGRSGDGILRVGAAAIPVALTSTPLRNAAAIETGRVVVLRDMSKVHQAERMKSEFLSNVSHELRTPITPIKGYAEILKRKRFPRDKTEQFLDGVLESTERLERIVEILVDFASIEAGRLTPREEPVEVGPLLDAVAERWRGRNGKRRIVRKGGRGIPAVRGDQKLLERALNELLDNAVKFSPDGGAIEVSASADAEGRRALRTVRLTIRDRGIGIEAGMMPELFQDFRQLDGSETRTFGGLGLGLAYVKRIVEVQGGTVEVESTPGKGSAFSLVLPVAEEEGRATRRKASGARSVRARAAAATRTAGRGTGEGSTKARSTRTKSTRTRSTGTRSTTTKIKSKKRSTTKASAGGRARSAATKKAGGAQRRARPSKTSGKRKAR